MWSTNLDNLCGKFSNLVVSDQIRDKKLLNSVLDELNGLDFRYPIVRNIGKTVVFLNQCLIYIPTDDVVLVSKFCQLITNLLNRQQLVTTGETFCGLVQWCLQAIRGAQDAVRLDILVGLESVLRSKSPRYETLLLSSVSSEEEILRCAYDETKPETAMVSVQCLEACTIDLSSTNSSCADVFLKYLTKEKSAAFDELVFSNLTLSCIRGLSNVIKCCPDFLPKNLGILLGIVKTFMVYDIKEVPYLKPEKVLPSTLSIAEPVYLAKTTAEKRGGKIVKQRKHRVSMADRIEGNFHGFQGYVPATSLLENESSINRLPLSGRLKTSDSDFSDSESGKVARLNGLKAKIRQAALELFSHIIKVTNKRTMFSYWSSFIPDESPTGPHNLFTPILKDSSPRVRVAALNALLQLLSNSKIYIAQAETSEKYSAFTSFSIVLGSMVKEMHRHLCLALDDNSVLVRIQSLKCLAALVQVTPYHRLTQGLLSNVLESVKPYINHRDPTVQAVSFIVMGCAMASEPTVPETKVYFCDNSDLPWILDKCLTNISANSNVPMLVKLESLQVVSTMTRNYFFCLVAPFLDRITEGLVVCFTDQLEDLRLRAGQTVDFIGQTMNQLYASKDAEDDLEIETCIKFWETLVQPLTSLVQCEEHPALRAVGCDCFASMGEWFFEHLPRETQILIITLLFGCARDEENNVKGAAVRALAFYVTFPALREDTGFVVDVSEVIHNTLNESSFLLLIKASWSLGNLSDTLILNKPDDDNFDNLLLKLLNDSITLSSKNDKICANSVRAMGNLLQLITDDLWIKKDFRDTSIKAVATLVQNAGNSSTMKVRWNCCYALGNSLKNPTLYLNNDDLKAFVFQTLKDLMVYFDNFKVRISSALALSCPSSRELYGKFYIYIFKALFEALENIDIMQDFSEYKHRANLIEQICTSICHLIALSTRDDLVQIGELAELHSEAWSLKMRRVLEEALPEKSAVLSLASENLERLKKENGLSRQQENALCNTLQIINADVTTTRHQNVVLTAASVLMGGITLVSPVLQAKVF